MLFRRAQMLAQRRPREVGGGIDRLEPVASIGIAALKQPDAIVVERQCALDVQPRPAEGLDCRALRRRRQMPA
jgi:hypothetical protein